MNELVVAEIFSSIQGEGTRAGLPCAFVRLSGCNLRCRFCDTQYAYDGGTEMSVDEVVAALRAFGLPLVQVTGGEPLLQPACHRLLEKLLHEGMTVLLETNGSLEISTVDQRVVKIMDLKCPSSGMSDAIRWSNLRLLGPRDEVKFVVSDRGDYVWARDIIGREGLAKRCAVLLSPAHGELDARLLAEWMIADRLPARLQPQLHKLIWGEEQGR